MTNQCEIRGPVTAIFLQRKKGKPPLEALVSTADLPCAMSFQGTWYSKWVDSVQTYYVIGGVKVGGKWRVRARLHRAVCIPAKNWEPGLVIDHVNHDGLDNTWDNLRVVPQAINLLNKRGPMKNNRCGVRGVVWNKHAKKWQAIVRRKYLGIFNTKEEAGRVVEAEVARLIEEGTR